MRFPLPPALPLLALIGLAAGCANMTGPDFEAPPGEVGAIDTGTYPNLNIAPRVAASQIASDEKLNRQAALASAQASQAQAAPAPPARSNEELRRLAADGGKSTLDTITGTPAASQ